LGAAGIDFDPEAPEPVEWLAFLRSLWPDDQASVNCLQEWFGYLISAETAHQKILFLHGVSRSGKGTIGRVLRGLLGPGQVAPAGMGDFGTRFGLESLVGKSVAIVPDARLSKRTDQAPIVEKMLSISGEDAITIDRKYAAPWCGRLGTRLVLLSNEIPKLRDAACALPNRFVVLKLTESFLGR
jgi:putative DNA primase/helicase